MLASDIITSCQSLLADPDQVHWTELDMRLWMQEGQSVIVTKRPYASTDTQYMHQCSIGSLQTLEDTRAWMILEVDSLIEDGDVITSLDRVSRKDADLGTPGWQGESGTPDEYIMSDNGQGATRSFWLLPGADRETLQVSMQVSMLPQPVTDNGQQLDLNDEWLHTLTNYCMFRLLSKAQKEGNAGAAGSYRQMFYAGLGETISEIDDAPKNHQNRREGYVR